MVVNMRILKIAGRVFNIVFEIAGWLSFLAIIYALLLIVVFETFSTHTGSMPPTIKPGSRWRIINKLKLGGRIFNVYDAAAATPFKVRRLPGYGILEKNDIIIFNGTFTESWDSVAMNMYRYYCKRAVAVAGDTLEIRDGHYRVSGFNGTLGVESEQMQVNYYKNYLSTLPDSLAHPGWFQSLPYDGETGWTIADFGPIVVPAVGITISIDLLNYRIYRKYIAWETGTQPEWSDDRAWLGDTPLDSYTFTENYCFAAGDHAIDSQDSRYWGLVPEKFIVSVKLHVL